MPQGLLSLHNIRHRYNGRTVLDLDKFNVHQGEIVGLMGPNGSGKSTLLKIAALTLKSTKGQVYFQGRAVEPFSKLARSKISLLTQEPYLLKRSVFDNIAYGLKIRGDRSNLQSRVEKALNLVGLAHDFAQRQWHELSGGEAQRVALAARLILAPVCLLLDEPTSSVDIQSAEIIRDAIFQAQKDFGATLVIVSHNRTWLDNICNRLVHINEGKIIDVDPENIFYGPWIRMSEDQAGRKMGDGQVLTVGSMPADKSACAFKADAFTFIQPTDIEPGSHYLYGSINSIYHEKSTKRFLAKVACAEHILVVSIPPQTCEAKKMFPGQSVYLKYNLDDVIWLG